MTLRPPKPARLSPVAGNGPGGESKGKDMMKKMIALVGAFALAVVFVGCASSQKPCSCKGCVPGAACACGCGQNPCACGHGCACTK
jgi:hypothetical protein